MRDAHPPKNIESYERLEFLGDSILEFLACEQVYSKTELREGGMTDYKQSIVSNQRLSARILDSGLDLDRLIFVGGGHKDPKTGKNIIEENMRADVFEALLAAIYLVFGMEEARRVVRLTLLG